MKGWKWELQVAAAGVAAASAAELMVGARRPASARFGHIAVAAGVATAYAHVVPAASWGVRSGVAFSQLPLVTAAHRRAGAACPLDLLLGGALTGILLHWLSAAVQ